MLAADGYSVTVQHPSPELRHGEGHVRAYGNHRGPPRGRGTPNPSPAIPRAAPGTGCPCPHPARAGWPPSHGGAPLAEAAAALREGMSRCHPQDLQEREPPRAGRIGHRQDPGVDPGPLLRAADRPPPPKISPSYSRGRRSFPIRRIRYKESFFSHGRSGTRWHSFQKTRDPRGSPPGPIHHRSDIFRSWPS